METELVMVDGRPYLARGWMNGITAPVGTILGPNWLGENLTVVESEANRVRLAHTRPDDFSRMSKDIRSVREHELLWDSLERAQNAQVASSTAHVRSQPLRSVRRRPHRR